jgi:hypothetical protein
MADDDLSTVLGAHDLVLAAGEVAEFDTRIPHTSRSRSRRHRFT